MTARGDSSEGAAVLWSGAPDPAEHFTAVDWFLVPFSVAWTAGVVTVLLTVDDPGFVGWTVGAVMVIVGGYLMIGRFL